MCLRTIVLRLLRVCVIVSMSYGCCGSASSSQCLIRTVPSNSPRTKMSSFERGESTSAVSRNLCVIVCHTRAEVRPNVISLK